MEATLFPGNHLAWIGGYLLMNHYFLRKKSLSQMYGENSYHSMCYI